MAFRAEKKADFFVIEISDELSIFNINECYEFFISQIKPEYDKVIVDVSAVEELDSSGFQLLMWLKKYLGADKQLSITGGEDSAFKELLTGYRYDLNTDAPYPTGGAE